MPAGTSVPAAPSTATATDLDLEPSGALPEQPARRPRRPWRTLLALLGGGLLVLAFPSVDLPLLAPLGPAALALAVRHQRARGGLWLGLVFGLAFFAPLLSWTGIYVGSGPWLALAGWEAVQFALLGAATAATSRLRLWPLWAAALWVADEAVRSRFVLGGFPWGRLGLSQTSGPFLSLAAYGGVPLVGFAVALTGTTAAAALLAVARVRRTAADDATADRRRPALRAAALTVAGVLAVPAVGGLAWLPLPGSSLTAGGPTKNVAVIQGNVPRAGLEFNAQRRAVLDNHVQETLRLADEVARGEVARPDLVVWPENSSDIDPFLNADAALWITRAAESLDAPILVGAVLEGPGPHLSNTAIVWNPVTGPGQLYVKRHPVPFGEYVPARSFFRIFSRQVDLVVDQVAGHRVGTMRIGGTTVGDVICFEVAYDSLVRDVVHDGSGMIVVQTNNATFGFTDESPQQLAMSRVRAVEFGRSVVIAATSGISAVIAPDGSVVRSSAPFTAATFVEPIAQRSSQTLAERLGAAPEWLLVAVGLASVGAVVLRAPARRRLAGRLPARWTRSAR